MATSIIEKSLANQLSNEFYTARVAGTASTDTLFIPWTGANGFEHVIFIYGIGISQRIIGAIAYARKSTGITRILNFGEVTLTISSDDNGIYIKGIPYMILTVFSQMSLTLSIVST